MKKGFTLLEMIIVVAIISVLFILSVPNIQKVLGVIHKKGCDALVKVTDAAIVEYRLENGRDPGSTADLVRAGFMTNEQTKCEDGRTISIYGGQAQAN